MAKDIEPKNYQKLTTYGDFVDYCLHRLGAPVLNIELDDQQIRYTISDALQMFLENDLESVEPFWCLYKVTEQDVKNGYIQMDPDILDMLEILGTTDSDSSKYADFGILEDPRYMFWQQFWSGLYGMGTPYSMSYYVITMTHLEMLRNIFRCVIQFSYRSRERKLYLYGKHLYAGMCLAFHCNKMLDPEKDSCIWDNIWLKKYATACLGVQWGTNLTKYSDIPSAGGVKLDGKGILDRYTQERKDLEDEHKRRYEEFPRPIMSSGEW